MVQLAIWTLGQPLRGLKSALPNHIWAAKNAISVANNKLHLTDVSVEAL